MSEVKSFLNEYAELYVGFEMITSLLWLILGAVIGYLCGSFPTAIIVSRMFFGFDIRTRGSGNMGSTNVFRQLGAFWGILVQIVDILKGYLPVAFLSGFILSQVGVDFASSIGGIFTIQIIIGLSAVAGHIWSVFAGFRGGKGVNTALGFLLAITPVEVGICLVVFLFFFLSSGWVSLGSLTAAFSYPMIILLRKFAFNYQYDNFNVLIVFSILLCGLVFYTHRENVKRIIQGTENRFEKFHLVKFKKNKK